MGCLQAPQSTPILQSDVTLPPAADARDGARGNYPLTELGTARRLVSKHGSDIKYVPERSKWLNWNDNHWQWDHDGSLMRNLAASSHLDIYAEGANAGADGKFHLDWARKCQTEQVVRKIVSLASDFSSVRTPLNAIDGHPYLVGLDEGRSVVDLKSGASRPAVREDLVTRSLLSKGLGKSQDALIWKRFLNEIFLENDELIQWIQRFLGYALTGLNSEHIFLFAHGLGANGKSVFINICLRIWKDYARVVQPETLMKQTRSPSGPTPDLARLVGARLAIATETEDGQQLGESLVKQLTGGDTITARDMYSPPFEFRPTLKFVVAGNHLPNIKGSDNGIWRRLKVLPFSRTFTPKEQNLKLEEQLAEEAPHILAWLVEGYRMYVERGLGDIPTAMHAITEQYRKDEDVIGQWLAERTFASGTSLGSDLFVDFKQWTERSGFEKMSQQSFGRRLSERNVRKSHSRSGVVYHGLSLQL